MLRRIVIARMLDDAFAHAQREIQSGESNVALLEDGDDAQRVQIMVEAQAMSAHRFVQRVLPGVTERRMADVVHQCERFRQVSIQPERSGNRPGKLRHLDGVRKTAAVVIRVAVGENLRLAR